MDGGSAGDKSYGGPGNDTITDDFGHDSLYGEDGDDIINGGSAPDDLFGGPGNDTIHGDSGADKIDGGPGNDTLYGDYGVDTIDAGDGDDVVYANDEGIDRRIDCGPGDDTLYADPIALKGGEPDNWSNQRGRFISCEHIVQLAPTTDPLRGIIWSSPSLYGHSNKTGTEFNDRLLGHHGSNKILGLEGDDVLWADSKPARNGNARKIRGQNDYVDGGAGNDTIYASPGTNQIFGREGDDYIQGNTGHGAIQAGDGNDTIRARAGGNTRIDAGLGDDHVVAIIGKGTRHCRLRPGYRHTRDLEVWRQPKQGRLQELRDHQARLTTGLSLIALLSPLRSVDEDVHKTRLIVLSNRHPARRGRDRVGEGHPWQQRPEHHFWDAAERLHRRQGRPGQHLRAWRQ